MFVVVAVTGGIAAYKTVHLVRRLVLDGHEVHVVPTADALRFVGAPTWEAISRNPVTTSVHEDVATVRHVALGERADLVIIAPATANTIARMAAGLADDLLGTTLLATAAPVLIAPAMHTAMWQHPATVANLQTLTARGVHVVGPDSGALTGEDSGPGRMSEPDAIHRVALSLVRRDGDMAGLRVVVSTGGTREPIDPVRFIGNRSSGRQGADLAVAAAARGAEVTLVAAHADADVLAGAGATPGVALTRAGTALELADAVMAAAGTADVVVMAAAVADYRPAEQSDRKLSKRAGQTRLRLDLVVTPDILADLGRMRRPGQTLVGFAAETATGDDLIRRGRAKLARKGADLLVVNEVGWDRGFETTENAVVILGAAGAVVGSAAGSKRLVADAVWDAVLAVRSGRARPAS